MFSGSSGTRAVRIGTGEGVDSGVSLEGGSQAQPAGGAWGLDSASCPGALCAGPAAEHRPLSQAGVRLVAALVARRGPGRSVPRLSLPLLLPSFQQCGPVGPPRQPAAGYGKWCGCRLWQSYPDSCIGARGCWPPVTARRRARGFLIWKKIHLISFVKLSPGGQRRELQTWARRLHSQWT